MLARSVRRAWWLAPLCLCSAVRAQSCPLPSTLYKDVLDGTIQDIAAEADCSNSASNHRIWLAQGLQRAAIRASDRVRVDSESRRWGVYPDLEKPLALEVDDANHRLYTLTDKGLYAEDISTPCAPVQVASGAFAFGALTPALGPAEALEDLRFHGPDAKVFVLTSWRLLVFDANNLAAGPISQALELYNSQNHVLASNPPAPAFDGLLVTTFHRFKVCKDGTKLMAYVMADMGYYSTIAPGVRPPPYCMLLCDLDSTNGYASPTFDRTPGSGASYTCYNTQPAGFPPSYPAGKDQRDYAIRDVDLVTNAGQTYAYLACGSMLQVQRVVATNAFATGTYSLNATKSLEPAGANLGVFKVRVDPANWDRVIGTTQSWLATGTLSSAAQVSMTVNEIFFRGGQRDLALTWLPGLQSADFPLPPPKFCAWAALTGAVDHMQKIVDVTNDSGTLPMYAQAYWISSCDGGVGLQLGGDEHIYLPTFGGVVRCSRSAVGATDWKPVPSSHMPAEVPLGSANCNNTENIELAMQNGAPHILTSDGKGTFCDFAIDTNPASPTFRNPLAPIHSTLPAGVSGTYGNDVAYVQLGSRHFAITDLADFGTSSVWVNAYQWSSGAWVPKAAVLAAGVTGGLPPNASKNSSTISIVTTPTSTYAWVAHAGGFFAVDLAGLLNPTPSLSIPNGSIVTTSSLGSGYGTTWINCQSVSISKDRLLVSVNDAVNGALLVYGWDQAGTAGPKLAQYDKLNFAALPCAPNSPFASFPRPARTRFHTSNPATGAGELYFAGDKGLMVRLDFGGQGTSNLTPVHYWLADSGRSALQDAQVLSFPEGLRLLVVKNEQAFAVLAP